MKKILFTLMAIFAISLTTNAQAVLSLSNSTPCTVIAALRAFSPPPFCGAVGTATYVVPPGAVVVATAPAGSEWLMARFGEPLCAASGALIEAPAIGCTAGCSFGIAPAVNISPGCVCPAVTGIWDPCFATITFL